MALTDKGNPWPNGPKLSKKVKVDDLERQAQAYDYAIAQIDAEAKSIEDGTHPELVARVKALNNARDARVGHAASRLAPPWGGRGRAAPPSLRTLRLPPRSRARERPPAAPSQIARATRDFEAEMVTLDRLRDHEIEVSEREMRRRLETAAIGIATTSLGLICAIPLHRKHEKHERAGLMMEALYQPRSRSVRR